MKTLLSKKIRVIVILLLISNFSFSQLITIGTGTLQNTSTTWPAPYGNWYTGARHQILITAADIYAAGGNPGLINSIAFDVATVQGVPLTGWEIKMGATTTTDLTTWETGLTVVSSPGTYTEVAGWNTHIFTTPFLWDGVSNIIIETCFDLYAGSSNYTQNAIVNQSSTAYNSTIVYYTDAGGACTGTTVNGTYTQRPNIQLDISPSNVPVNLGVLPYDYPTVFCDISNTVNPRVKIKNWGTASQSNFDVSYSIDGGITWVTETNTNTINPGDTLEHIFTSTVDFSAAGTHTLEFAVFITGDTMNYNDTLNNVQIINHYSINTFPFIEDFETGTSDYFNVTFNSNANAYIYNDGTSYVLRMEGKDPGGWTGGSTTTTPTNAWVDNVDHHSSALSCNIDATTVTSLELLLDLKQYYSNYGPLYSWFRVLINGTQIADINGTSDFHPTTVDLDPWQTIRFDLQAYAGTIFTLELQASNYYDKIYSNPGDNAFVDNIIIREKLNDDVGINALLSQTGGCGVSANEEITVQIKNFGGVAQTGFDVAYQVDGGTIIVENIGAVTINPGTIYDYTFTTLADLSTPGAHTIKTWTALTSDGDLANDTLIENVVLDSSINVYPLIEDFETFIVGSPGTFQNGWTMDATSTYQWQVNAGGTSSTDTGPLTDHTTGTTTGIYVYTEASSGIQGDYTYLISPCLDLSVMTDPQISFWYHMFGSTIDTLYLDALVNGVWIEDIYHLGGQQTATQSSPWQQATVNLSAYTNADRIRFRARRGSSYLGDIAIDDINIYQTPNNDISVNAWINPNTGCGLTTTENITIELINMGLNQQDSIPVGYTIDGGATIVGPEYVTGPLLPGDTIIYTFTQQADMSAFIQYDCFAFNMDTTDSNQFNDTIWTTLTNTPMINTFPYFQDFEGASYWSAGGTNSTWELGTPAGTTIIGAASGSNSWMTGLSVNYNNNDNSWVIGPCFDFSSLVAPIFEMKAWWNSESSWDGAALQYSLDGGTTWTHVGAYLDPNNWYTDNSISGLGFSGNQEGWSNSVPTDWLTVKHDLTGLGGISDVKLRIVFGSDGSVNTYDGFAFDDIHIYETPSHDLAVNEWIYPLDDCVLTANENITIMIVNYGLLPKYDFPVSFSVDGGITFSAPEIITDTILPGDTLIYTFTTTADFSNIGIFDCFAVVADTLDELPQNDTLNTNINIFSVITLPYAEDFETFTTGSPGTFNNNWDHYAETTYQWQVNAGGTGSTNTGPTVDHTLGTPSGIYLYTEASSGTQGDSAWVLSPCIDLSSYLGAKLTFWYHMWGPDIDTLAIDIFDGTTWTNNIYTIVGQQQANQTDPWLKASVNLTPYIFVMERFRFRALRGASYGGDISIDDIYIEEPQPFDIMPLEWITPQTGCIWTNSDSITVNFYNNGLLPQDSILVGYSIDGGATVVGPEIITDTIYPGDTLMFTFAVQSDFSANGSYNCSVFIMDTNDQNILNDTLFITITNNLVSTAPFSEDFETFTVGAPGTYENGWNINPTTGYTWNVNNGSTSSTNTGPLTDHTTGTSAGIYVFTEASNGVQGDVAELYLPCIDLSVYTSPFLSFWYHMYGSTIDTLYVDIFDGGIWYNGIFSLIGEQQTSGSDPWLLAQVDISSYLTATEIRFRAIRGSDFYGDIALDDINIMEPTLDVGITELSGPNPACEFTIPSHIVLKVANFGTITVSTGDTIPVGIEVNGGTPVIEPFVLTSDLTSGTNLFFVSVNTYDFTTTGNYDIVAYTIMQGDADNLNDTIYGTIYNYGYPLLDLGANITTTQPDTVVLDAGTGYLTYMWQDSTTTQTYNVTTEGWYYVTVTDTNGCSANDSVYVGNSLSAEQIFKTENSISIYPNPNNGIFTVNAHNKLADDWIISLINISGQTIYEIKLEDVQHFSKTIDVSDLASGLYYLKINNNKGFMVEKIVLK